MTTINLEMTLNLREDEYFKVGEHIFTTNDKLKPLENKIHFCGDCAVKAFKEFEDQLSLEVMNNWTKLSKALDQTTSCAARWDNRKIIQELINGNDHPVAWYVENCKLN
ncbi:MAG: hypothetical protein ACEPOZ_14935 [Marinifilaceae bacterium]